METGSIMQNLSAQAVALGLKVVGAIVIWIIAYEVEFIRERYYY